MKIVGHRIPPRPTQKLDMGTRFGNLGLRVYKYNLHILDGHNIQTTQTIFIQVFTRYTHIHVFQSGPWSRSMDQWSLGWGQILIKLKHFSWAWRYYLQWSTQPESDSDPTQCIVALWCEPIFQVGLRTTCRLAVAESAWAFLQPGPLSIISAASKHKHSIFILEPFYNFR